ncbi:MAG: alanine racemase domain protein [Verrucomicrobiales bacterium]|nr:alanine racemase domain protein [Verrucomicrobiales bacterium]
MSEIAERLQETRERLDAAALRSGRAAGDVELLAVSKTFPPSAVEEAARAGQRLFGESRVQECLDKIPALSPQLRWHFIGHLQSNKVRKVLPLCEAFHSVDSTELALDLERIAEDVGCRPQVYLQVNVAGDGRKFGFTAESVRREIGGLLELKRVEVVGLMTIPPLVAEAEDSRRHFAALRELRDLLEKDLGVPLPGLSMGMSGDYEVAVEEGSTIVRVGSFLFGGR